MKTYIYGIVQRERSHPHRDKYVFWRGEGSSFRDIIENWEYLTESGKWGRYSEAKLFDTEQEISQHLYNNHPEIFLNYFMEILCRQ